MRTYTINLDGMYYAVGMDLFAETVFALDRSGSVSGFRTMQERNDAIRSVCTGYKEFYPALHVAVISGQYIGMLYTK